ncbi:MAG: hypothetical protein J6Y97_03790 [Prevotella sp.]|nr:hypothetical protein [Prevotella sp.]
MKKYILFSLMLLLSCSVQDTSAHELQAKQCVATTKKGTRCKLNSLENSKYCHVHQAKSPVVSQCKAKTKEGKRCSRAAKTDGYCTQHYNMHIDGKR